MKRFTILGIIGVATALLLGTAGVATAATWYVNANVATSGNGTSWQLTGATRSFKTLQEGIAAASSAGSGDEVWVAAGTYSPGSESGSTFTLKNKVRIRGGFTANTTIPSERYAEPALVCILSGVYVSGAGNVLTIVTGDTVLVANDTVLDGFTITGGNNPGGNGAAIFLGSQASPTIENCRMIGNVAGYGAGVYCSERAAPSISNCRFENNQANFNGGAITIVSSSFSTLPTIQYCQFIANVATISGGAVVNANSYVFSFRSCLFLANEALGGGGGT